jgi:hypothetical protein
LVDKKSVLDLSKKLYVPNNPSLIKLCPAGQNYPSF